ncbi:MAG: bifunctional cobalt-precorrin-7 (C(5))-methyltransferase/cobalt-precorrin-6B (C(15))-methyltransferase, partial [Planktothrix sp.]
IEKTATGTTLIEQNRQRFQVNNVVSIHGEAPDILHHLRSPNRIFIDGSGENLSEILGICSIRLSPGGIIVLALATIEHLNTALNWLEQRKRIERSWSYQILNVQLSRSVSIANSTRFSPLNPITILTIYHHSLFA